MSTGCYGLALPIPSRRVTRQRTAHSSGASAGSPQRAKDGTLVRKAILLQPDEAEALRRAAYEERRSEASIVRELLRKRFGLPDE